MWALNGTSIPKRIKSSVLTLTESAAQLTVYATQSGQMSKPSEEAPEKAEAVVFSADRDHLRIGSKVFRRDENDNFVQISIPGPQEDDPAPRYVEEFAARGNFLAVATRRIKPAKTADTFAETPNVQSVDGPSVCRNYCDCPYYQTHGPQRYCEHENGLDDIATSAVAEAEEDFDLRLEDGQNHDSTESDSWSARRRKHLILDKQSFTMFSMLMILQIEAHLVDR